MHTAVIGSAARFLGPRSLGAVVGASLITLCALPTAQADIHLAVGSRFEPLRYTSPSFPNQGGFQPPSLRATEPGAFQSTSLNPYLGLFFAQRYGVMASLDIAYAKLGGEMQGMADAMPAKENNSFFQFGVSVGFKAYITQPRTSKIAPYVYADIFKYFASISTDHTQVTGEQATAQAAMLSPIGGTFAVGAEYFLSPGFSIGSEILGLRVSNVSSEYHDGMPGAQTRHSAGYTQVSLYTGITLNFRFQVSASVKATEEDKDSDDRNGRRRGQSDYPPPPPPAPPPPPPPAPEAVD